MRSVRWRRRSCPTSTGSPHAVRETGGTVVWIKTTFKDDALQSWSTYFEMVTPQQGAKRIAALTADSKGHELWAHARRAAGRPHRREEPLQRLHPGLVESRRGAARARPRHRAHHRHRHQCVLRVDRARRHDAQFPDHHGHRRQRGGDRRGPQRLAVRVLSHLRRHHVDRHADRLPRAQCARRVSRPRNDANRNSALRPSPRCQPRPLEISAR